MARVLAAGPHPAYGDFLPKGEGLGSLVKLDKVIRHGRRIDPLPHQPKILPEDHFCNSLRQLLP